MSTSLTVGLVGGLGPEATIDYYRRLQESWARADSTSAPPILIDSLDYRQVLAALHGDLNALVDYLVASIERLTAAGAHFGAISANTPHIVFDQVLARTSLPLLSIVEVCAREAGRRGLRRISVLGTRFTMEADFYPRVFEAHGIKVVPPADEDRRWVHDKYVGELLPGRFSDDTRAAFRRLIARLGEELQIEGVVLAGTELPILLPEPEVAGIVLLDTTGLHVAAIVDRMRDTGE